MVTKNTSKMIQNEINKIQVSMILQQILERSLIANSPSRRFISATGVSFLMQALINSAHFFSSPEALEISEQLASRRTEEAEISLIKVASMET